MCALGGPQPTSYLKLFFLYTRLMLFLYIHILDGQVRIRTYTQLASFAFPTARRNCFGLDGINTAARTRIASLALRIPSFSLFFLLLSRHICTRRYFGKTTRRRMVQTQKRGGGFVMLVGAQHGFNFLFCFCFLSYFSGSVSNRVLG